MSVWSRKDIEVAFIREFSVLGANLGSTNSPQMRSERVRLEILRNEREDRPFHDAGITYREAYRECFGRILDVRGGTPAAPAYAEEDETDDEFV
jgi:hypothetical protein